MFNDNLFTLSHNDIFDNSLLVIGIDHDTVCAGVVGTAIRNSTSCAGRRAAAPAGTTSAVPDCSTNHDSADRISGQFLFYHDHNFTKSKGNLRFRRLVPLFVPIGVCVATHDDGTAQWRHKWFVTSQSTGHEPRAQRQTLVFTPKVALPCNLQVMICRWMNDTTKICTSDAMNLEEITHL